MSLVQFGDFSNEYSHPLHPFLWAFQDLCVYGNSQSAPIQHTPKVLL